MHQTRVNAIDYHVGGEPLRIVDGVRAVPGTTMAEKALNAAEALRHERDFLVTEPRGHADMFGAFLTPPVSEGSSYGVLFFDAADEAGFKGACGHGSIALATAAFEQGWIKGEEGWNEIAFDVPFGTVRLSVEIAAGNVRGIAYRHVPSMLVETDVVLDSSRGQIAVDLVDAGAIVALIDSARVGLPPSLENLPALRELYLELHASTRPFGGLRHKVDERILVPELVLFVEDRETVENRVEYQVAAFFSNGSLDRSPCGTGTSARLAQLYGRGLLKAAGSVRACTAIGSSFEGRIAGKIELNGHRYVLPEILGRAFMTGSHSFIRDGDDELGGGFRLR